MSAETLNIMTLVMAFVSMLLSCMALWPQCRHGLVVVRDAVLWAALIVVVVGFMTVGWRHHQRAQLNHDPWQEPVDHAADPWSAAQSSAGVPVDSTSPSSYSPVN